MSSSTSEGDLPQVCKNGGAKRSRTADLLIANETLYQLSYSPIKIDHYGLLTVALYPKRSKLRSKFEKAKNEQRKRQKN